MTIKTSSEHFEKPKFSLLSFQCYLDISDQVFERNVKEQQISRYLPGLPRLDRELLDALAHRANDLSTNEPRRGWAITRVFEAAARYQGCDLFIRSLAAWYLGRACNAWEQPKRVNIAIARSRRGFLKLKEEGWIAACDWQENVLSWTKPDFNVAVDRLKKALDGLQHNGFDDFVPHCRVMLAVAQILIGNFDEAGKNIQTSEKDFELKGDSLNQARCWFEESARLRQMAKFDSALNLLSKTLEFFQNIQANVDIAKTTYMIGMTHLFMSDDIPKSIECFKIASSLFMNSDLILWQASTMMNMGLVYIQIGRFIKAEVFYRRSRKLFLRQGLLNLVASNLNDNGKLNIFRGFPLIAIQQFTQAIHLFEKLGANFNAAVCIANLGQAYGLIGRYQDALLYLEKAKEYFKSFQNLFRLGDCEAYEAVIWSRLGIYSQASECLDKAANYFKKTEQHGLLIQVFQTRAEIFFSQSAFSEVVNCLEQSLSIAETHGIKPHIVYAQRTLGESLINTGDYSQARDYLKQALANSIDIGMVMEQAACMVALGRYYKCISAPLQAYHSYQEALSLSDGCFSEINYLAHSGLGELAEAANDLVLALQCYQNAEAAISKIRLNLWQPALVGSYLHSYSVVLERGVELATQLDSRYDVLSFIEGNKSTTLLRQLNMDKTSQCGHKKASRELNDLQAEIHWLQGQMSVSFEEDGPFHSISHSRELRKQLLEKVKHYDALIAKVERQEYRNQEIELESAFNLEGFRALANNLPFKRSASSSPHSLGKDHKEGNVWPPLTSNNVNNPWLSLDYYLLETELVTVALGDDFLEVYRTSVTTRIRLALDACQKTRLSGSLPTQEDLSALGNFLIPIPVAERLLPETNCIISPHRDLHNVPWAALRLGKAREPLVAICTPVVTPSLKNLIALWERDRDRSSSARSGGLLVGLSHFQGRRPDLPSVKAELDLLSIQAGQGVWILRDEEANRENLQKMAKTGAIESCAWMHVASHVFSDPQTGRLSGIALWDGDLWLDQLRDMAPLPRLVTFSACNSIQGRVYEGDEHLGLAVTCLIAGAGSVVGDLWPVPDTVSADFMERFYKYYQAGDAPAMAVANTQREMITCGDPFTTWGGFVCMGAP